MRLGGEFSISGWAIGAAISPGTPMVWVAWETAPLNSCLNPLSLRFWI
jgi:hypothetical protein